MDRGLDGYDRVFMLPNTPRIRNRLIASHDFKFQEAVGCPRDLVAE